MGEIPAAIAELDTLSRINPQNHRAFQRKGELLAVSARSKSQLEPAREALLSALHLNSEETGTLVLLGEVEVARGNFPAAEQDLASACQANPHAANAWFLRGYVAWKRGEVARAARMLAAARTAGGLEKKPLGATSEGDVQRQMYAEAAFLDIFERQWDGSAEPKQAYKRLETYLQHIR